MAALTASAGLAAPAVAAVPPGPNGEAPRPSAATGATVAAPAVTGPIARTSPVGDAAHGYPFLATDVDLAKAGYVEEEYVISGQATRYNANGNTTATVTSTGHPYSTRIVVRRPVAPAKFNGTVIAEWTNVSNNWDQEVDWFQTHEHLLEEGYAWVGVSAQRVGLHSATGLKLWSPSRYGALDLTAANTINDDTLSFDVFSQAVKAVRSPAAGVDPLGSLAAPDYVIATGHSQSAGRLRTYANSVQPLANIVDAFILHGGGGAMRTDLPTPVFRINSEGDLSFGIANGARAADSPTFRNWEVAGASHGDWKLITDYGPLRKRDIGTYPGGYPGEPQTCTLPSLSRIPQHMVQNALTDHTFRWVAYGIQPPSAPVISTATAAGGAITRDALGLAQGGIRLSQQEAAIRINSGTNSGGGFCALDGSSLPMTDAQLATLYPTVQSYVDKVVATTLANAEKGYIVEDFTRDPAWYTDIRDLVDDYGSRIDAAVGTRLKASAAQAEAYGTADDKYTAIFYLEDIASQATSRISDAAVRDGVLRQARAVIALLQASIDNPTSTSTTGTVGGAVPATLALSVGAPATFGTFTPGVEQEYTATSDLSVTSTAGDAALSVSAPGFLTNGAFSLAEPLRVELAKSAWTGPTSNEKVVATFKQLIKKNDALRTGAYSKTVTFTLSTTNP
ncbi:hypothetical protein C8N24_5867 [Solirubrobacter pauli]|uniref:Alpha/beta hydrolase domain-containing protein n=1 Tax=Solirubrobacter pauli TaxID=166793 RepID=A0A660L326_9ACTN|nr:hypothetical protein C8N24_5867 [Solirubrobacter pauli]